MKIIDISREMFSAPVYPGDVAPEITYLKDMEKGGDHNYSFLVHGSHAGTHCDAPLHFVKGAKDIGSMPITTFVGECRVLPVPDEPWISSEYLATLDIQPGERILLKTGADIYLTKEAADYIAAKGIVCLGVEAQSVGAPGRQQENHCAILEKGIGVLECIDLSQVEPGKYFLCAAPVLIGGAEGAVCRAYLLEM